jgi:UDP-N-acetylglucosamine 4,6-dehydratase/5-epimerase
MTGKIDLEGLSILITGGTGSFGNACVADILTNHKPRRLAIFSRDEMKQWEMQQAFSETKFPAVRYLLGDVRDAARLDMALRDVDIVIHAAALKHVPAAEYNPFECIRTNVFGAENIVNAAIRNRVRKVIALSTDKAANPVNLYGASKLASDKIFVAGNNISGNTGTRFAVVRYGNVLGSRGSILPLFRKLIAAGAADLPITDPRMTRFWITLPQGVSFVLSSLSLMRGGEIFVPKIPSMKVADLAAVLAPHLPHRIIGVRPGEKLHEVMITEDDSRHTLEMSDRYIIQPDFHWWRVKGYHDLKTKPVNEGFRYASNTNDQQLTAHEMEKLILAMG